MLTHPTHGRLITLGLVGMAKALDEQQRQPDIATLAFEERIPGRARRTRGHLCADLRLGSGGSVVAALVHRGGLGDAGPAAAQLADPLARAGHPGARAAAHQRLPAG